MASISARKGSSSANYDSPAQALCLIVGVACLLGFLVDLIVFSLPPNFMALEWRIGILQQTGDRSIILLFGLALVIYGLLDKRKVRQKVALLCLMLGVMFSLSGVLVLRDSMALQSTTMTNIANQESQARTQLESIKSNPQSLPEQVTPENLQEAEQLLTERSKALKNNAKVSVLKLGISSLGNLIITGFALLALGRFGMQTGNW